MNMQTALINWKNFFRMMVGKEKLYPIKVVRMDSAKEFELLHASKAGDVGYNLTCTEDMEIPAMNEQTRMRYGRLLDQLKWTCDVREIETIEKQMEDLVPRAVIPTGIKIEMPTNLWCSIEARSSSSKKMLITPDAIIDSGYTGEMFVVIYNFGFVPHKVKRGDQLAQLIFHERIAIKPTETDKLRITERGETGFGSTGQQAKRVK